jgi:ComF family protein
MVPMVESFGPIDSIVPVPLHATKARQRGYNQSQLLAKTIGQQLGVDTMPLLVRTRETQSQVGLSQEDRSSNVDGAFDLDPGWSPAPGGRYVLIDDVRTTSSTLNACAKAMLETAPARIFVATLAFDIPIRQLQPWLDDRM